MRTSASNGTERSSNARAIPCLRVGENVPDVTSPITSPSSVTGQCARGMPRPVTRSPREIRDVGAAFSASSASRPQKAGLAQPTAQPDRAMTG